MKKDHVCHTCARAHGARGPELAAPVFPEYCPYCGGYSMLYALEDYDWPKGRPDLPPAGCPSGHAI